jgi:hypothetical protein
MRLSGRLLAGIALLTACATQPAPTLTAPDAVPAAALDALCARLRMDAIASTAPLTIVRTTRPLATQPSMTALAMIARGRVKGGRIGLSAQEANRELPLQTAGTSCTWRPIRVADMAAHHDEMLVEVSAPAINPFAPKHGGLFARVTVGGEGASWYWVALVPHGDQWAVGGVSILSQ